VAATPSTRITPFDSANELWQGYWQSFETFSGDSQIPTDRKAQLFLNNQSPLQLAILTVQRNPPKEVNKLSMSEIQIFLDKEFDSKHSIIIEDLKFWNDIQ